MRSPPTDTNSQPLRIKVFGGRGQTLSLGFDPPCSGAPQVTWSTPNQGWTATGLSIEDRTPKQALLVTVSCLRQTANYIIAPQTVMATQAAFAVLSPRGNVAAWGNTEYGGHTDYLKQVHDVIPSEWAFAALHHNGEVSAWGRSNHYSSARSRDSAYQAPSTFTSIYPTKYGFIALGKYGNPVLLGPALPLGERNLQKQLSQEAIDGVPINLDSLAKLVSTSKAYAGLLKDSRVILFGGLGESYLGGIAPSSALVHITDLEANETQFLARKADGSAVIFSPGLPIYSYHGSTIASLHKAKHAIALTHHDGMLRFLVPPLLHPLTRQLSSEKRGVRGIYTTLEAVAILYNDGTVEAWDDIVDLAKYKPSYTASQVRAIVTTERAFAALKSDGRVETWGDPLLGGDSGVVASALKNVQSITANDYAFAALRTDGTVVTWGMPRQGGDSAGVRSKLTNISAVYAAALGSFLAERENGGMVAWGDVSAGGSLPAGISDWLAKEVLTASSPLS